VGNAAATFPLQRLGADVWPVHTVQFSNHPGYGAWKGKVFDASMIREIIDGIEDRGVLGECDAVLSGYMGSVEIGEAILDAVSRVRRDNPAARYCCDPIIGDVEPGIFVCAGVPEFMRDQAVPVADVVTPNQFELEYLTARKCRTTADALDAIDRLHAKGPRVVLVTSQITEETPRDALHMIACDGEERFRVQTPRLPITVNGAGDIIAGLFLLHLLRTSSVGEALANAAASVYGLVCRTAEVGSRELLVVEAQDEFITPSERFKPERL
jgi:pyridoxine kinase